MSEKIISLRVGKADRNVDEALKELGYERIGAFKYDYPQLEDNWYERINTGLFEKEEQLYYFAGVSMLNDYQIDTIRIGELENKKDKNPELLFSK